MDRKITRKTARALFPRIFCASYCQLQFAGIHARDRVGYNAGVLGWNWDLIPVPDVPGVAICTGYRPFGERLPAGISKALDDLEEESYRLHNERPANWIESARQVEHDAKIALQHWAASLRA